MKRESNSLSYKVTVEKKPFFKKDTLIKTYEVFLKKNENDSLYGYDFKISDSTTTFYNLDNSLYIFDNKKGSFKKKDKIVARLNQLLIPNSNLLAKDLQDTTNIAIKKKKDALIITKKYTDKNEFKNIHEVYSISLKPYQLLAITTYADFQNTNQYDKFNFGFVNTTPFPRDIEKEVASIRSNYFEEKNNTTTAVQEVPEKFPNMRGTLLATNQIKELTSFKNKVLVIDYWYLSCYPCIKSIPVLNKIHKKYSQKDVEIIGVNIIDNKEQRIELLKEFVIENNIEYPIFLTNDDPLSIKAYPTLFILNKDHQIIDWFSGYDENREEYLSTIIEKELKK